MFLVGPGLAPPAYDTSSRRGLALGPGRWIGVAVRPGEEGTEELVGFRGDTLIAALVQVAMERPEGGELVPGGYDALDKGVVIRRRAPVGEGDGPFEGEFVGQAPNADDGIFKGHLPAQSIDTGAQGRHVGETARDGIISSDGGRPIGAKTAQGSQSF